MSSLPTKINSDPAEPPSLAALFAPRGDALLKMMEAEDLTATQLVSRARSALDQTGREFVNLAEAPSLKRAGLWLLEMVKSGAGILDSGLSAEIVWHETPAPPVKFKWRTAFFYAVAAGLFLVSLASGSRLGMMSALILAALRLVDSGYLARLASRLPFIKAPKAITDESGRSMRAEALARVNAPGFVNSLTEGLKTADQVLIMLAEPEAEYHWSGDPRLMSFIQGLLEAGGASDGEFALTLIGRQLESLLRSEGITQITYDKKTADLFDVLPAPGQSGTRLAAPALLSGDEVICRGTIWSGDDA